MALPGHPHMLTHQTAPLCLQVGNLLAQGGDTRYGVLQELRVDLPTGSGIQNNLSQLELYVLRDEVAFPDQLQAPGGIDLDGIGKL